MVRSKTISLSVCTIALLSGIMATACWPWILNRSFTLPLILLLLTLILFRPPTIILLICISSLGFCWMTFNIQQHFKHALPENLEGHKINVTGIITSLVEISSHDVASFEFCINKVDSNETSWDLPATVRISWQAPPQQLRPGDNWHLVVKLKRPRNYANPGSFDVEKFYLQQRIIALGYVVAIGENIFIRHDFFKYPINNIRQYFLGLIEHGLAEREFTAVIIAQVLGVKHNMPAEQMQIFQRSGVAHLMAISGLHIGLIGSMFFWFISILWRYAPSAGSNIAAPWIAAWGALFVSIGYAFLAGFSVATQRSLIMLAVFLAGYIFKRNLASRHGFFLALACILLSDPFAVLSLGFWLSFIAVAFLIFSTVGRGRAKDNFAKTVQWLKPQIVMGLALLPITVLFFSQCSIIAPLANTIAIPWVGFIVVPISLIAVLILPLNQAVAISLLKLAETSFSYLWLILQWFAKFPVYSWQPPQQYLWLTITLAMLGAVWLFIPIGVATRWWGLLNFVPLLATNLLTIPYGQAELTLLDVGQGLSVIIRTQHHTLVYDTGAKLSDHFDLGTRVVAPYLQTVGVKYIAALMISHGDNDHIGGARGLLNKISANSIITSDPKDLAEYNPVICQAGQQWQWDGVIFSVLHPQVGVTNSKRNDHCCVLMVQAGKHKALLTGDIESISEQQLILRYGEQLQADVMLVPHHGSKTSSSLEFLQYTKPKFALIPAGYKNQYSHPRQEVVDKYHAIGAAVLNTVDTGSISFRLGGDLLLPHSFKQQLFCQLTL